MIGSVRSVDTVRLGTSLVNDVSEDDTILVVRDVFDFDEDGGTLLLDVGEEIEANNPILNYISIEESSSYTDEGVVLSVIVLDPLTPVPVDIIDVGIENPVPVHIYPIGEETQAVVYIERDEGTDAGEDTDDDPESTLFTARLSHSVAALLPDGFRTDETGYENVTIIQDGDDWVITDVLGTPATIDGSYIDPDSTIPPEALTDGEPPEFAPVISADSFAVGSIQVNWSSIDNADPVFYKVYASNSSPVVVDPSTLVEVTTGTSSIFNSIAGVPISTSAPTYVVVVSSDADGDGPASNEASATARMVEVVDLGQDVVDIVSNIGIVANQALDSANGKNKIHYSSDDASSGTPGTTNGDIWYKITANRVAAMWIWDGTVWASRPIEHTAIASLDAGKITVGTLDAARIAANTISTEKLLVTDLSNSVDDPRFTRDGSVYTGPNSTWNTGGTWTYPTGVQLPWTGSTGRVAQLTASSGAWMWIRPNKLVETSQGDVWYYSFWVRKTTTGTTGDIGLAYDIGSGFPAVFKTIGVSELTQDTWVKVSGQHTISNPSHTSTRIAFWSTSLGTGEIFQFTDFTMRRANTAELLVDGSIRANHIFGNTVQADVVTGNLLYVGSIEANQITTGTLSAQMTLSGSIKTANTGQRLEMNSGGLYTYNSSNVETSHLSPDSGGMNLTGTLNIGNSGQISVGNTDGLVNILSYPSGGVYAAGGLIEFHSKMFYTGVQEMVGKITGSGGGLGFYPSLSITGTDNVVIQVEGVSKFSMGNGMVDYGIYMGAEGIYISSDRTDNDSFRISASGRLNFDSEANARFNLVGNMEIYTGGNETTPALAVVNNGSVRLGRHPTTSSSANTHIDIHGWVYRSTSLRADKVSIKDIDIEDPKMVLSLKPRLWKDKIEYERWQEDKTLPEPRWVPGFVVEELLDAGLGQFVSYGDDNEPMGVSYDRLVAAVIPYLQNVEERLNELEKNSE